MTDTAQWVTLITVVAGFLFQLYRENRQRKWDVEDRARIAAAVTNEAQSVARKVVDAATEAAAERHKLAAAVDENTAISTKAFHEANTVNQKLEALGVEHNALQRREQKSTEHDELIAETVVDTQDRVKRIEQEVTGEGK